ncbi:hypothetical protein EK21DRAFT_90224 [Setomelanomma holmii]|uniref:Uncharacterized protein n=1 Tax=Setomelanomma holmii TaxID=210430 RepID=A0A9P4LKR5_9PLEO|nr:hypothetical protein EK21DRAFT_90224 [Setomelanomma holmii]
MESQVDFSCIRGSLWEGLDHDTAYKGLLKVTKLSNIDPNQDADIKGRARLFDRILQGYTSRSMTNAGDSLNAFLDLDLQVRVVSLQGHELKVEGWIVDLDIRAEPFSEIYIPRYEGSHIIDDSGAPTTQKTACPAILVLSNAWSAHSSNNRIQCVKQQQQLCNAFCRVPLLTWLELQDKLAAVIPYPVHIVGEDTPDVGCNMINCSMRVLRFVHKRVECEYRASVARDFGILAMSAC